MRETCWSFSRTLKSLSLSELSKPLINEPFACMAPSPALDPLFSPSLSLSFWFTVYWRAGPLVQGNCTSTCTTKSYPISLQLCSVPFFFFFFFCCPDHQTVSFLLFLIFSPSSVHHHLLLPPPHWLSFSRLAHCNKCQLTENKLALTAAAAAAAVVQVPRTRTR